jgi:hypothetical protein
MCLPPTPFVGRKMMDDITRLLQTNAAYSAWSDRRIGKTCLASMPPPGWRGIPR